MLGMVASAMSFSLMGVCVKQVGGRIPAAEVVFARAIVSVALSWWLLHRAGIPAWGNRRWLLIWRGAIGTAALLCVYAALAALPLAAATVLQYLYPPFTALLAWLMLGEPIGKRVLAAMALGWLGVLLVAQPAGLLQGGATLALVPVLIAVAGALFTAFCLRKRALPRHERAPAGDRFLLPLGGPALEPAAGGPQSRASHPSGAALAGRGWDIHPAWSGVFDPQPHCPAGGASNGDQLRASAVCRWLGLVAIW